MCPIRELKDSSFASQRASLNSELLENRHFWRLASNDAYPAWTSIFGESSQDSCLDIAVATRVGQSEVF